MAEAANSTETTQKATEQGVDVALINIEMPCLSGIDTIAEISNHYRCLVVTIFVRPGYLKHALQADASKFPAKDAPPKQLVEAIRHIHSDLRVIGPALAGASLFTADSPLTDHEIEIARPILQDADTGTITGQLFITKGTVRNQVSSIITKTNTSNRVEAMRTARDNG